MKRRQADIDEPAVVLAMRNLSVVWNQLFPVERCRLVRLLIQRVQLRDDGIDIEWQPMGWAELVGDLAPNTRTAQRQAIADLAG